MTEQTTPVDDTRPAENTTSTEDTAPVEQPARPEPAASGEPASSVERTEPQAFVPQPRSEPQPLAAAQPVTTEQLPEPATTEQAVPQSAAPGFVVPPPPPFAPPVPGEPQDPPVKVKKDRRVLRAVLRWTAATVVFAAVGASAAYGITRMERTDVPGLATEADGRWDYPAITKPPLPSGSPGPFAGADKSGAHSADLRALLLPAPKGAKADASLRGDDGWLSSKAFLSQYAEKVDRETVGQMLTDYAVRHIAARGWTTADGTRTRIYLLQFDTAAVAEELVSTKLANYDGAQYALSGAATTQRDEHFPAASEIDDITRFAYTESKPYGAEQVRESYLSAGDTIALVVQSHKGVAPEVPFQQTVVLQSQLLD
ncbi:hypothetical protein [Streptomyces sp. NPDC048643]|uniref:hypothetical protein n=1 Tax=Streptomyces sp. NPDC048643 TaxID=3155637 RepID=UPI0034314343